MIYLLGSIIFATAIFLIFKLFNKYGIRNLPAIVINYFTAGIFGFILLDFPVVWKELFEKEWFPYAIGIGFGFIFIFNLMALTTQKIGASVASITVKMSVIIPIVAAFFLYGDKISFLKITGILLALTGIYFASKKESNKEAGSKLLILLPLILFLGGGTLDSILKFVEDTFIGDNSRDIMLLTPSIFLSAGSFGLIIFLIKGIFNKNKLQISMKDIGFGFILGIINYGSIFCLFFVLNYGDWESSMVFPINNVGIVLATVLSSVLIFQEKLSKINKIGIGLSVLAIIFIAVAS